MGKGRWLAWLLLLVMTLAGCGTEAEVVTSEVTFEEESESQVAQSEHQSHSVTYATESYMVVSRSFLPKYSMVPFLITSKEKQMDLPFLSENTMLLPSKYWMSVESRGKEITYQELCQNRFDDDFFETNDLLLIPQITPNLGPKPTVGDFQYDSQAKQYELQLYSNDTKSRAEAQGVFLHVVEVEKGLMDENINEILRITQVDTSYAYSVVNYVGMGNTVSLSKMGHTAELGG